MRLFKSERIFLDVTHYMDAAANDLLNAFQRDGYNVNGQKLATGEWDISINKGNWFEAALGLNTALKIRLTSTPPHIHATARIGIFGQQIIPAILAYTLFWPIAIAQVWGMIKQSSLDDRAMTYLLESFETHKGTTVIVRII